MTRIRVRPMIRTIAIAACAAGLLLGAGCRTSPGKKAVRGAAVGAATVGVASGVKKSTKNKTSSKAKDAVDVSKPGVKR